MKWDVQERVSHLAIGYMAGKELNQEKPRCLQKQAGHCMGGQIKKKIICAKQDSEKKIQF